ncbi:small ribosomal subunit biogenesis GTPase RsgA [Allohahella marinimesophila]|uniref:small ribosomal subunit biogenesis GTPase RsgA n=1 Tax=Allohahella marinimesophila TaxID=1054972 RepID=UPI0031D8302F
MSKRRLTVQQKRRIDGRQQQHGNLQSKGDRVSDDSLEEPREGLIVSNHGQKLLVAELESDSDGVEHPVLDISRMYRCHARSNLPPVVAGDRVVFQIERKPATEKLTGVVSALMDRRSLLSRPDKFGRLKPVAANVDRICVVVAPLPEPHFNLTDRYIVAAELSGAAPLIIFNKADLVANDPSSRVHEMRELYTSLGYDCILVSAKSETGTGELLELLDGTTAILCGQSGVGKSALAKLLIDDQEASEIAIGALSEAVVKGRHTTTAARLYRLKAGDGFLIDSPGVREFGLWHLEQADLTHGFVEFRPFLGQCRFSDCSHTHEPDCAILLALEEGHIDPRRWQSYRATADSLDMFEIRTEV